MLGARSRNYSVTREIWRQLPSSLFDQLVLSGARAMRFVYMCVCVCDASHLFLVQYQNDYSSSSGLRYLMLTVCGVWPLSSRVGGPFRSPWLSIGRPSGTMTGRSNVIMERRLVVVIIDDMADAGLGELMRLHGGCVADVANKVANCGKLNMVRHRCRCQ